jgi:hypothetical protein
MQQSPSSIGRLPRAKMLPMQHMTHGTCATGS